MTTVGLAPPRSEEDWWQARRLIETYVAALGLDLGFQGLARELEELRTVYGPPAGAFLLAQAGGRQIGCVGLRQFAPGDGEIKRLYVDPAARGLGVGRLLAEAIVVEGRRLGYTRLLLDTLPSMGAAQALYASLGFRPVPAYRYNPLPGTVYLELRLR